MANTKFLYNLKLTTILGMLLGTPSFASNTQKSIWDKINSTPMSEKIAIAKSNCDKTHLRMMSIAKYHAYKHIEKNIHDSLLADFMIQCIALNGADYYSKLTILRKTQSKEMITTIKTEYKWFDDLMKYLSGKMTDLEFYRTGFFTTINQPSYFFTENLYDIERWCGFIERNNNTR